MNRMHATSCADIKFTWILGLLEGELTLQKKTHVYYFPRVAHHKCYVHVFLYCDNATQHT